MKISGRNYSLRSSRQVINFNRQQPDTMASAAFNRKRVNQLTQLTLRRNIIESLDINNVTAAIIKVSREELTRIRIAHDQIVNEMFGQDDCDEEKLREDIERFQDSYDATLNRLSGLQPRNVTQLKGQVLNDSMPGTSQQFAPTLNQPIELVEDMKIRLEFLINNLSNKKSSSTKNRLQAAVSDSFNICCKIRSKSCS